MPTKREFIASIASLGDDDEIVIALTYPKPEEGFTLGDEGDSPSDSPADDTNNDDDDDTVDNEDGTVTEFYPAYGIDVEEVDGENGEKRNVAFLSLELGEEDEDEEDEGEGEEDDSSPKD